MNANASPGGWRHARIVAVAVAGQLWVAPSPLSAVGPTELVENGTFENVLVSWSVDEYLTDWIPYEHPAGTVSLHPDSMFGYTGMVICQPLDVAGIAGQSVNLSIDLGCDWAPPPGNTVGLYLEYLDAAGVRHRPLALSPDNSLIPAGSLATFSGSYVFPPDADRLVGVAIDKLADGSVRCDNVSVTGVGLTPGPAPRLHSIDPPAVAYGGSLVIRGANFGAAPGEVLVGGKSDGVTVQSWTPDTITVQIGSQCTGGVVQVDASGPRTCERRVLGITSPHFTVEVHALPGASFGPGGTGPVIAVPGQKVQVDVRTAFRSGFTTSTGVQLACVEAPGAVTFSPSPVLGDGGSLMVLDTTGISPGVHTFTVTGSEPSGPDRSDTFQIDLRAVGQVELTYDSGTPVDGATFTSQSPVPLTTRILDASGGDITFQIPAPAWSSTHPSTMQVYRGTTPWSEHLLLPHENGSATIRATMPDGSVHDFDVWVSLPAEPRVTSHTCNSITNDPAELGTRWFHVSGPMGSHSSSIGDLGVKWGDGGYSSGNTAYWQEFTVGGETDPAKPGTYMWREGASVALSGGGSAAVASGCTFHISNDPAYGMITGHVAQFGGAMYGHGVTGTLEFYDASSGALVLARDLWEWTFDYLVPRVPPGIYRLRLDPSGGNPAAPPPRWFPNGASFADAASVVVTAGGVAADVNFTLFAAADPPAPPIVVPPARDPVAGTFGFTIRTTSGRNYDVQKSTSLLDGSWFTIRTIWGDGSDVPVVDSEAVDGSGFYRILPR